MAVAYFSPANRKNTLYGIFLMAAFAALATFLAGLEVVKKTGFSPLIIGIVICMVYGNTFHGYFTKKWSVGILFSSKIILRTAIIFYGFRITFQSIGHIGLQGVLVSFFMVITTFLLGIFIGRKLFNMDRDLVILASAGSAVCGAAAVMATESTLKSDSYKAVIALGTVVLFGTISMFCYPAMYEANVLHMSENQYGIYIGGSVHEVAQVVAAGNAVSDTAAASGIVVKMTRVMMLAPLLLATPLLLAIGFFLARKTRSAGEKIKIPVPWFVFGFILVAGFNSFNIVPTHTVDVINVVDTFLLTMAMCALGIDTTMEKFRSAGKKIIYMTSILFLWLVIGGYFITKGIDYLFLSYQ
jgi:uncharacterized integral membrane protein (TIGR00698 family)